jgi:uncharacterized protein YndB with AHSA1/START domain
MSATYEPLLEDSVEIDAPTARVWPLVSDVVRMPEWSPQVISTRLRNGYDEIALGAEFTNRNRQGELEWITHGRIVELEPERRIAFRIEENWVIWSFTLEPAGGSTRLVQRREAPDGISELSLELTDGYLGGQEVFTATMRAGMRQTLEAIKAAAEG